MLGQIEEDLFFNSGIEYLKGFFFSLLFLFFFILGTAL